MRVTLVVLFSCWASLLLAQDDRPLSPRTASYDMQLRLDTETRQVEARQVVTFTNPSADTIWTMPFHMYYNAFKNNQSTFLQGTARVPRVKPQEEIDNCEWGWIEVLEVKDQQGRDLTDRMAYIQPDDGNPFDHSVLEVRLREPVLPYGTYELAMRWHSQIPDLLIRTGHAQDFFFMAQWYPKLGVYEPAGTRFAQEGQWNCHQYHAITEYYGEFGRYTIAIDVPSDYQLGASGLRIDLEEKDDRTIHTYQAEDVIDFTWSACPRFVEVQDEWEGVQLKLLITPEHLDQQDRFLEPAKHALSFFRDYLGPYPYPSLTIVCPPYYGLRAGAMEYPTLITAPTLYAYPRGIRTPETLTIHELTHQYFMQMVATNEQEEPWMDEGFTSFFEAKIMDQYYPGGVIDFDRWGLHVGSMEFRRGRFIHADNLKVNPLSDFGWHFRHGSYSEIVYGKAAIMLQTLEGLVGEEVMQEIMQTYFERWQFKHPGRQDFIDVVNEIVPQYHRDRLGDHMDWYFAQTLYGTDICDYAIGQVSNTLLAPPAGFLENSEDCTLPESPEAPTYRSRAIVFRLGGVQVPQEVRLVFDDGEEELVFWDGRARSQEWTITGPRQIVSVSIDPAQKIGLDINQLNNSYTTQSSSSAIRRTFTAVLSWLQRTMVLASGLV